MTTDSVLNRVQDLVSEGFESLCAEFPDQRQLAGTLFLGKYYAKKPGGILMLGLNPGASPWPKIDVKLHPHNFLLEGEPELKVRYWTNARKLFNGTTELRAAMDSATFSFCCPYRTARWNGLPKTRIQALIRNSKPVLAQMMTDCRPSLVILAGVEGAKLFSYTTSPRLEWGAEIGRGGDAKGTYQWRAVSASFDGASFVVAQIPHLSRAGAPAKLKSCAEWLTSIERDAVESRS